MTAFEQSTDEGRRRAAQTIGRLSVRGKIAQCLEMQEEMRLAVLDPQFPREKKPSAIAAWDKLEDRLRVLREKPLPGTLTPAERKPRVGRSLSAGALADYAAAATEQPTEPEPEQPAQAGQAGQGQGEQPLA